MLKASKTVIIALLHSFSSHLRHSNTLFFLTSFPFHFSILYSVLFTRLLCVNCVSSSPVCPFLFLFDLLLVFTFLLLLYPLIPIPLSTFSIPSPFHLKSSFPILTPHLHLFSSSPSFHLLSFSPLHPLSFFPLPLLIPSPLHSLFSSPSYLHPFSSHLLLWPPRPHTRHARIYFETS